MQSHSPQQFLTQLGQALSADKLSVGFLLGAGCPCSIKVESSDGSKTSLIDDIKGLTSKIDKSARQDPEVGAAYEKLDAAFKQDGVFGPNIEVILNRIRALREVAGSSDVRGLSFAELDGLDKTICQHIRNAVSARFDESESPYRALARFLRHRKAPQSEVFTTNYDLLMERALEAERVPFFDGFVGSSTPFFDQRAIEDDKLPSRWARLWKLHGSVNWRIKAGGDRRVVRSEDCDEGDELLIHPSHMKYDESRRMPYFVMIDRLRAFIRNSERPVALFVVGYSFSDQHLNEAIVESLRYNASSTCFAIQFGNLEEYKDGVALAQSVNNLCLAARDGAILRRRYGAWLADPATDIGALSAAFSAAQGKHEAGPNGLLPCELHLGDFKQLGDFLDQYAHFGVSNTEAYE
ncbi:MAG: SIR2 family protein [Caulobacter sp.]|nr:SIR2 family protein [Caulobacter sp.]